MIYLTQVTGFLKPFAWLMGIILNAIYEFVALLGIPNIALCIVLFTLVVKMLMLPLTIKQQKYTKLSSKMQPELSAIQEKYKGKKDEDSMRRQQAETQEVYAKYGTSPMGGCLPLLISLPIMFALYRVIYAIPAYVNDIGDMFNTVATAVQGVSGHADIITQFIADKSISVSNNLGTYALGTTEYTNSLIDILAKFNTENWSEFLELDAFSSIQAGVQSSVDSILSANMMFGLNILDRPKWNGISVLIPLLAMGFQFLQGKLQTVNQPQTKANEDNPMAQTNKTMMTVMPIMSGVFCLSLPICIGIYWIASSVFTILQTIFINKYLEKTDMDAMIEKNVEKANKRREKLGIVHDDKVGSVARSSTKSYETTSYDPTSYKKNSKKSSSGSEFNRGKVPNASSISDIAHALAQNAPKSDSETKDN